MRHKSTLFPILAFLLLAGTCLASEPRLHQTFDFDWKFTLTAPAGAEAPGFDDGAWTDVQLPHDWSMTLPYLSPQEGGSGSMGFMQGGLGWYRKTFAVPAAWRGRRISLEFDGVYHRATVFVTAGRRASTPMAIRHLRMISPTCWSPAARTWLRSASTTRIARPRAGIPAAVSTAMSGSMSPIPSMWPCGAHP